MTFILDILLDEGQFSPYLNQFVSPMWLVLTADGLSKSVSTPRVLPNPTVKFNFPARLILNLNNLDNAFLQVSLCTVLDSDPTKKKLIASSKMKLNALMPGRCSKITFPLLDSLNHQKEAALITIQVSFSDLRQVSQIRNTYPSVSRQGPAPGPAFGNPNRQRMTYTQRHGPPVY